MAVFHNVGDAKDMAIRWACPVILGCQVNRDSYGRKIGIPEIHHGLESSNIEHTSDTVLGLWYPCKQYDVGTWMEFPKENILVTEDLLLVKVLKQKKGYSGRTFKLFVDPAYGIIGARQEGNPHDEKELVNGR
jgi:hypothetical protein